MSYFFIQQISSIFPEYCIVSMNLILWIGTFTEKRELFQWIKTMPLLVHSCCGMSSWIVFFCRLNLRSIIWAPDISQKPIVWRLQGSPGPPSSLGITYHCNSKHQKWKEDKARYTYDCFHSWRGKLNLCFSLHFTHSNSSLYTDLQVSSK
jgi:hypothetical protein